VNKTRLIEELAGRTGLSRARAGELVQALFDPSEGIIAGELRRGGRVSLPGFGRFEVRERAGRRGRHPRSGREIEIPASRACSFRPHGGLRRSMKDMVGA
jgi:DNA-binding protein HU-beta